MSLAIQAIPLSVCISVLISRSGLIQKLHKLLLYLYILYLYILYLYIGGLWSLPRSHTQLPRNWFLMMGVSQYHTRFGVIAPHQWYVDGNSNPCLPVGTPSALPTRLPELGIQGLLLTVLNSYSVCCTCSTYVLPASSTERVLIRLSGVYLANAS